VAAAVSPRCPVQTAVRQGQTGRLPRSLSEHQRLNIDCHRLQVWEVLRKRMVEGVGEKWRLTYKSLLVIEFLVKQSSQHVVQVVLENAGVIQELQKFQYKDEAGKDWVRGFFAAWRGRGSAGYGVMLCRLSCIL
jgi:hypothetical protein